SNSLLHHLHEPMVLWRSLKQYANPGAAIFIMDLLRPASSDDAQKLVTEYAGDEPEILRKDFLASLYAAFSLEEVRQQLADMQLSHLQVTDVSDRHLIIYGYLP
ncbi:MAG: SAM-dependent methyltransferase, partial [Gammaproteobacteria bacterium]